jgi:two-component system alkaline phosphatase synthesis response regulator PhoP
MNKSDIRILLVDDEPDILEIVGYNLKNEGYQVFTANNGQEAIESAKKNTPHLILLDIMMPEMDGIEACEKIRNIKTLENVIISFLTARGEDYSQVAGFEAGADDYITKPIKPKVLISKIKSLLRRLNTQQNGADTFSIGDIVIDRDEYVVHKAGKKIALPRKELLNLVKFLKEKLS